MKLKAEDILLIALNAQKLFLNFNKSKIRSRKANNKIN